MKKKSKKKSATAQAMSALGSAGGNATLKKYGPEHFQNLIAARWKKQKKGRKKRL